MRLPFTSHPIGLIPVSQTRSCSETRRSTKYPSHGRRGLLNKKRFSRKKRAERWWITAFPRKKKELILSRLRAKESSRRRPEISCRHDGGHPRRHVLGRLFPAHTPRQMKTQKQLTSERVRDPSPLDNRNFIVLTTARSGSTLLKGHLNQHESIRCFGEIFKESFVNGKGLPLLSCQAAEVKHLHETDL